MDESPTLKHFFRSSHSITPGSPARLSSLRAESKAAGRMKYNFLYEESVGESHRTFNCPESVIK